MNNSSFIYVTYIKSTPEKVWAAITKPEFTCQYWASGITSDWKKNSSWKLLSHKEANEPRVEGTILESIPPTRLVITWFNASNPTDDSTVTFDIQAINDMVCLTLTHGAFKANSSMAPRVAIGWPRVLSSLKSLLETGAPLDTWAGHEQCANQS